MNKTVKELVIGREYIFIEANPDKEKDLNIVRATLKENEKGKNGYNPVFIEKYTKGEVFFTIDFNEADKPLDSLLVVYVNSNYDKPEVNEPLEKLFGTWANPIGYFICNTESIDETITEYTNFLIKSLTKYEEKIRKMMEDFGNKKRNYIKQVDWLNETKF